MEQPNLILPMSSCRMNMQMIQDYLDTKCAQEPSALMERMNELASLLATSAQTQASVKFHLTDAVGFATQEAFKQKYPPSMAKSYSEGICAELIAEYELACRHNACITHSLDSLRSILSFTKQELYQSNIQTH